VSIHERMNLLQAGVRGWARWGQWIWGAHPWRCPLYLVTQLILVLVTQLMLVLVTHKVGSMANPKACTLHTFLTRQPCVHVYHNLCSWCYVAAEMVRVCCNIMGGCHNVLTLAAHSVATYPQSTHCLLTLSLLSITLITRRA